MIKWHQVTWYSKLLAAVVFVLALVAVFYFGVRYEQVRELRHPLAADSVAGMPKTADVSRATCYQNDAHFIITEEGPDLGSSFLIKWKNEGQPVPPCVFNPVKGDMMFSGYNFVALVGNKLVLDQGSAPNPRCIMVFDLDKQDKILEQDYYPTNGTGIKVVGSSVGFWENRGMRPTPDNCPNYQNLMRAGNPGFVQYVTVDLDTLQKTASGPVECIAFQ